VADREERPARLALVELLVVLKGGEDGYVVAECPALPGCISQGRTREEALENIREAIELCLESRQDEGWDLPGFCDVERVQVHGPGGG
jgi:predicted RNase H-like HicB family nuclease